MSNFFFGYGSLVDRRTHNYTPAFQATAKGWRRAWRATADRDAAYLTALPDPTCAIDGLIAAVPPEGWPALDKREAAYARRDASQAVAHSTEADGVVIYAIAAERLLPPSGKHPVALSYLDVVIAGYLQEFGTSGAERFFATTLGWQEAPFVDDRRQPRYPRAQPLSDAVRLVVDSQLVAQGARVVPI